MGEMADFYLDTCDDWYTMFSTRYSRTLKECGEGPCPKCGASTVLKTGIHGKFYGCINFPKCKGSRNCVSITPAWQADGYPHEEDGIEKELD